MKTSSILAAIALLSGLSAAQQEGLPDCAGACVRKFTADDKIGDCGRFEIKCICSNQEFLNGIACCLEKDCPKDEDKKQAVAYAKQICTVADVKVPEDIVCKDADNSGSPSTDDAGPTSTPNAAYAAYAAQATAGIIGGVVVAALAIV